jgi:hypothetical protein
MHNAVATRVTAILVTVVACGLVFFMWMRGLPSVVGTWKGTDQFGDRTEHFYKFNGDGTFEFWSRWTDGTLSAPAKGSYSFNAGKTVIAKTGGFPPQLVGRLTLISKDELEQSNGFNRATGVVFRRAADK